METFADAEKVINDFVLNLDKHESYTLERIEKVLDKLGNPQDKFKTVHVAGTSGKTSTSYFVANMLQAAGFKTGLSISPHIEEINERVQIGLQPLSKEIFLKELQEFLKILNTLSIQLTYFELLVAFAYWYFAKVDVDYAVVEVGLGGLLDGTNVIKRPDKICVITDIGLDHTQILGDTLAKITIQKAGIIQDHNHVFMYHQPVSVKNEVINRAEVFHATLHYIEQPPDRELPAQLPAFQKRNWNLAKEVCEFIFSGSGVKPFTAKQWFKTADITIPGRLETISYKDKLIVMDGAHNSQKMKTLIQSTRAKYPHVRPVVLLAVGSNKDLHLEIMTKELEDFASFVVITKFGKSQDSPRHPIEPAKIAANFKSLEVSAEPNLAKALSKLLGRPEQIFLITGSLYLISEVRKLFLSR